MGAWRVKLGRARPHAAARHPCRPGREALRRASAQRRDGREDHYAGLGKLRLHWSAEGAVAAERPMADRLEPAAAAESIRVPAWDSVRAGAQARHPLPAVPPAQLAALGPQLRAELNSPSRGADERSEAAEFRAP